MAVSADALDDDWWMDPEDKAKEEERMGRKRSRDDNGVKRSKRKNAITQVLLKSEEESFSVLHSATRQQEELQNIFLPHLEKEKTVVEMNEIKIRVKHFVEYKEDPRNDIPRLDQYLKIVCPKWDRWISKYTDVNGSPLIIIICSSAKRALELRKELSCICTRGIIAKLFAKHMKIAEQKEILSGNVTPIAMATPDRLIKLLNEDIVSMVNLKCIVVDWYWRNQKMKRFVDIPEVFKSFSELYCSYLNNLVLKQGVKLILY